MLIYAQKLGWVVLTCLLISGCDSEEPNVPAAAPKASAPEPKLAKVEVKPTLKGPTAAELVASVAARVDSSVDETALVAALAKFEDRKTTLASIYQASERRHYDASGAISERGTEILDLLADVKRHGLDSRPYGFGRIDHGTFSVHQSLKAEQDVIRAQCKTAACARVAAAIALWLKGGQAGEAALVAAGLDKLDSAQRHHLDACIKPLAIETSKTRQLIWQADVTVSAAVIRYLVDFLLAKPAHPFDFMTPQTIAKLAEEHSERLVERIAAHPNDLAAVMRAAWPIQEQYKKLLKSVDHYAAMVEKGGWGEVPSLPKKKLTKGAKSAWFLQLRTRLKAEGYDVAEQGETYDDELLKVVQTFQRRHQLQSEGIIGKGTLRELNVSAQRRLRQLKLALTRWRSALARDAAGFYVHVNIAAQQMQLWVAGKRERTHRVIVGKDNEDIDYSKRVKGKINRTKMFKAEMKRITLAPRWYPTPRVVDLELGPALAKDPEYFEKHGYVSEMRGDGTERVYQRSGPKNLLGVVKFQFPNKHAIYMHDTPSRGLFKRARRAYSHGCIRLHRPKQLAYDLLGRDRNMKKKKIDKIIKERDEKVIMLKNHFWVYIDYISASVEPEGDEQVATYFWSDIYAYDKAYFTGQLPVKEVEKYKAASLRGL
ncbi:MAG: hypothetical protein CMH53_01640 [Myxococcales bacterium]|nr:hypothetical protein [Myxococcales bacterium]